jgi:peptide/nickel transport system substrate-binding protein
VGEQEFVAKPVGTGPYKFVEWKTGEYLDLVRNDHYWGTKPSVKMGHMVFVPDAVTRVQMLQAGEVDLVDITPCDQVKPLEQAGYNVKIPVGDRPAGPEPGAGDGLESAQAPASSRANA